MLFKVIILLVAVSGCLAKAQRRCRRDEEYNKCGTACPASCADPKPEVCTLQCVDGCFCPKGKIRDQVSGLCINPEDCRRCPEGETYSDCGVACEKTCDSPNPQVCPAVCLAGCLCNNGTVREMSSSKCLKPEECPKCGEGKEYNACGTACPLTCRQPYTRACTEQCVSGCFCRKGLVKDEQTGKCIPVEDCSRTQYDECPEGEEFKECGEDCRPVRSCSNQNPVCTKNCKRGCFCPEGQIRDDSNQNQCIPINRCSKY